MRLRKLNRFVGILGIVTFAATGVWMRVTFAPIGEGVTIQRMMMRSAHIYILLSALLNFFASTQQQSTHPRAELLARIGAILLALAPPVFLLAFVFEPKFTSPGRPICLIGMVFCLVGTLVRQAAARRE